MSLSRRAPAQMSAIKHTVSSIRRRYARWFGPRFSVEHRLGGLFLLDQINWVDRSLLAKGVWEPDQISELMRLIKHFQQADEQPNFLDIGAHGALYSILMVQHQIADRVWAFEPDPINRAQLHANLFLNGLVERVQVIDKAASNERGKMDFFIAGDRNRGESGQSETTGSKGCIEVETDTIDAMISTKSSFIVAKIDVEGGEMAVLEGMEETIAQHRCLFQIESFESSFPLVERWLVGRGFQHQSTIEHDHFFYKGSIGNHLQLRW